MRFFLGLNRFAPNHAIFGDMAWEPLINRQKLNMLRLWNRLVKLENNRLTKKIFLWEYSIGRNNWTCNLKTIFNEIENTNCFDNIMICDLRRAKEKLLERSTNIWSESILNKPKLRTYILFKQNVYTEKYVSYDLTRKERSILAQLRAGILPLEIETGRYINIPAEERLCKCCSLNVTEDEFHFLFVCNLYDSLRLNLFTSIVSKIPNFVNLDNIEKLKVLFSNFPRQLARFVKSAYEKRSGFLYPPLLL